MADRLQGLPWQTELLLQTFPTWLQWFVFRKGEKLSVKGQPPLIPLLPFPRLPPAACLLSISQEARKHGPLPGPGPSSVGSWGGSLPSRLAVRALGGWGAGAGWGQASLYSRTLCLPLPLLSLGSPPHHPRPPASCHYLVLCRLRLRPPALLCHVSCFSRLRSPTPQLRETGVWTSSPGRPEAVTVTPLVVHVVQRCVDRAQRMRGVSLFTRQLLRLSDRGVVPNAIEQSPGNTATAWKCPKPLG